MTSQALALDPERATLLDELATARATLVATTRGLTDEQAGALPEAPWNEPGGVRSVRQVLVHVIAETAPHAGHADFLRESIDGRTAS